MQVAIQAADLDAGRIDGTRVYISQLLKRFGALSPETIWHIYHRGVFNPLLAPPKHANYIFHTVNALFYWTQTRFAWEIFRLKPQKLWMPVQALPMILPKETESTVTIHDLAFKYFPQHFPKKDRRRLEMFAGHAIRNADKIIAVSESTKRDIVKFYPEISPSKIRVIHHGFDASLFHPLKNKNKDADLELEPGLESERTLASVDVVQTYALQSKKYLLYVGALQPRKNIHVLLDAFARLRETHHDMQLVLAGEKAWMWESIQEAIDAHPFKEGIILTGSVNFAIISELYRHAGMFVFPSLYEGFGIPLLEAMASGVPVISADNSSLPEVGGDAALYFHASDTKDLIEKIETVWNDANVRNECVARGLSRVKLFSWDRCAEETMQYILEK